MSVEADFLISLGQALSAAGLYGEQHPAYGSASEGAFRSLLALLHVSSSPQYSFLEGEVIFANRRLRELKDWQWSRSLAEVGAERIEVAEGIDQEEFERFLAAILELLETTPRAAEERTRIELPHAKAGPLAVHEARRLREQRYAEEGLPEPGFDEETDAVDHIFDKAETRGFTSLAIAGAVVQSLSVALQHGRPLLELLIPVRHHDEYTTVHSMNVAVLSMALAESVSVAGEDLKEIGEAALLHDLGKALTPVDVLQKPGKLTADEWDVIKRHPEDGARIIIRSGGKMEFAAVVAYEHHLTWQGGGYPDLRYPRRPHPVSQLVQICDIFDALRTERPFRGSWPVERILRYFNELSNKDLNPDILSAFRRMLRDRGIRSEELDKVESEDLELAAGGFLAGGDEGAAGREATPAGAVGRGVSATPEEGPPAPDLREGTDADG